ncbi:hypothetical protein C1X65_21050 [Pseudomonas sp. FW305-70]|nr:hypothetical protein C1X65_21050 [Pseudomonas sp. FW305-70]
METAEDPDPFSRFGKDHTSNVGAGLLAKAQCHPTSMSTDTPPSRASPLPQVVLRSVPIPSWS